MQQDAHLVKLEVYAGVGPGRWGSGRLAKHATKEAGATSRPLRGGGGQVFIQVSMHDVAHEQQPGILPDI